MFLFVSFISTMNILDCFCERDKKIQKIHLIPSD